MPPDLKKFWIEFIELYKSLPELWRRSSDEYSNGHLKKKAYEVLVEKYKEIDANANVFAVKRKINNIRTCFRRELSRVKRSEQMAMSPSDIYIPRLWYYKNLDFLKEEEEEVRVMTKPETSLANDKTIIAYDDDDDDDEEISRYIQHQPSSGQSKKRSAIPEERDRQNDQTENYVTDKS
uniref:MADF domain-containing protein n=1 Tax=Musca domestica TaxID=7370 RepID=A0A1I8N9X6_MUSDO